MSKFTIHYSLSGHYTVDMPHVQVNEEKDSGVYKLDDLPELRIFAESSLHHQSTLDLVSNLDSFNSDPNDRDLESVWLVNENKTMGWTKG